MKANSALTQWLTAFTQAVEESRFIKLSLTKPTAAAGQLKSVDVRPILVKRELKLSFTYHNKTNDIVKNHALEESTALLSNLLGKTFTAARLCTQTEDLQLHQQSGSFKLTHHAASNQQAASLTHNRAKNHLLETTHKPYLQALGLTDAHGNILKSAQDKFRQINKYIEVLDGLLKQLPPQPVLRVADMGSGKGYLTFALYDHLVNTLKRKVEVTGVEYRPELVKLCNAIAKDNTFTGLSFTQGGIVEYDCTGTHVVIALHACDTATDEALAKAVHAGADLIVVAPCCHKQVRRNMAIPTSNHPLHTLLQHGTYAEKMAEMLTDALRAEYLELANYSTKVFEFIGGEHTPKNVMITAIKQPKPLSPAQKTALQKSITETKNHFGLTFHQLEKLLGSSHS